MMGGLTRSQVQGDWGKRNVGAGVVCVREPWHSWKAVEAGVTTRGRSELLLSSGL